MPEIHLRLTYSACGLFTKNKEKIQIIKETGDLRYIYHNKIVKACFHSDMTQVYFKDVPTRIASEQILHDRTCNIAKNTKYDGYQRSLCWNNL